MLEEGDPAPDIEAESTQGAFHLSDVDGPVVLFFFPKAGSPVCTREACSFRDSLPAFDEVGATVVGVSPSDSAERLEQFAADNDLDYPLIADEDGSIAEAYDIAGLFGMVDKRVTYVIDADGVIADAVGGFVEMFQAQKHVESSLAELEAGRSDR